jgi:hypothetical protein
MAQSNTFTLHFVEQTQYKSKRKAVPLRHAEAKGESIPPIHS